MQPKHLKFSRGIRKFRIKPNVVAHRMQSWSWSWSWSRSGRRRWSWSRTCLAANRLANANWMGIGHKHTNAYAYVACACVCLCGSLRRAHFRGKRSGWDAAGHLHKMLYLYGANKMNCNNIDAADIEDTKGLYPIVPHPSTSVRTGGNIEVGNALTSRRLPLWTVDFVICPEGELLTESASLTRCPLWVQFAVIHIIKTRPGQTRHSRNFNSSISEKKRERLRGKQRGRLCASSCRITFFANLHVHIKSNLFACVLFFVYPNQMHKMPNSLGSKKYHLMSINWTMIA